MWSHLICPGKAPREQPEAAELSEPHLCSVRAMSKCQSDCKSIADMANEEATPGDNRSQ